MAQLTFVEQGVTTTAAIEDALLKTREQHGETLQKYHEIWYQAGSHTWSYTQFLGVGIMKPPSDLWAYQDIMYQLRPRTVIETGTYAGGSALWLACLSDMLDLDCNIYTIDIENYRKCEHPKISFIIHDSTDPGLAADLAKVVEYPLLVILDSDHSAEHVYKEMCLYAPLVDVGGRLVCEDTCISWPEKDRGAAGGLTDYLTEHPHEWRQDLMPERWLMTFSPGGWLERIAPYAKKTS